MIKSFFSRLRHCTLDDSAAFLALLIPVLLIIGRAAADAAVVIVCLLFLWHSARTRNWSWIHHRWVQVSFLIWVWLFISSAFALADKQIAFLRALTWIRWPLIAAAIVFWCSRQSWWERRSSQFLLILITAVCIDTIAQYIFGMSLSGHVKPDYPGRLTGPFNRLVVGIFLARLFWPALAALLAWSKTQVSLLKNTLLPLCFIGLVSLVVLLSGERMAFLLTGLSLGTFFLCAKGFRKPLFLCGLPLVIAIIAVVATQPSIRARAVEANSMLSDFSQSGYGIIFNNALLAWQQAPLLGVGPKNFVRLCEEQGHEIGYVDAQPDTPDIYDCARHPHNPYLEWLADTGLIGLGLFITMVFFWCRQAIQTVWQQRHAAASVYLPQLCLAIGLIPFLWPLQGNMSMFINWNGVLFWWTIGFILSGLQKRTAS
jgi:O-antigen ligase